MGWKQSGKSFSSDYPAYGHCPAPGMTITHLFVFTGARGRFGYSQVKRLACRMHNWMHIQFLFLKGLLDGMSVLSLAVKQIKILILKTKDTALKVGLIHGLKPRRK